MVRKSLIRPGLCILTLLASSLGNAGPCQAQTPPAPASAEAKTQKVFTNKTEFHLPIQINNEARALLQEVSHHRRDGIVLA
jgi:hypothetical protein